MICNDDFEDGYEKNLVVGVQIEIKHDGGRVEHREIPLPNLDRHECPMCFSIPRYPVKLPCLCGKIACASCLLRLFKADNTGNIARDYYLQRPCPLCRTPLKFSELKPCSEWDSYEQSNLKDLQLRCPYECGFIGTVFEMDIHQVRKCRKRIIQCPHRFCNLKMAADEIQEHFPKCTSRKEICENCQQPVGNNEMDCHNCVKRLKVAVSGM